MKMPSLVILAGGLATRLRPITKKIPKSMIEVAGKPFITHQLEFLATQNIKKVILCVGFLSEQIEKYIQDGSQFGIQVKYSYDGEKLLGTGGSIKKALPLIEDEHFFVMYGDSWLEDDFQKIYQKFHLSKKLGLMTVFKNEGLWDTSNIYFRNDEIILYDKKLKSPKMQHIDWGLGILSGSIFTKINEQKFDLVSIYKKLLEQNQLSAYEVKNRFYEIGSKKGYKETAILIKNYTHVKK